jgi:hypothetical protein
MQPEETASQEPTGEQIIDALCASGWLLEQDTASLLDIVQGFHVVMGRAYQDPDDPNTSREIDVYGYREFFRNEDVRLTLGTSIIAECKHSSAPYVFVGRAPSDYERHEVPTEHLLRYATIEEAGTNKRGLPQITYTRAWRWLGLHELPGSPSICDFRATQMTRLERKKVWNADNRGIFTSLVFPLAKALRALQEEMAPASSRSRPHDQYSWATVALF